MRLWSIHPKYLDCRGLSGLWREALLAKKVLESKTEKYRNHPQLDRFKRKPISFINRYLKEVYKEACKRGYCFDKRKIGNKITRKKIPVTDKQIKYEFMHLKMKLKKRDFIRYKGLFKIKKIEPNPMFRIIKGDIEEWEKVKKGN
ncbi:pyrimidine dimer DNA glycosylase/endonuclease V [Candidatus Woesearchaeota archaeon]|nr:pyrimidine dimer DNA glycosylase/endonuclease V [Candidatus Woesearchaeota archaeon]